MSNPLVHKFDVVFLEEANDKLNQIKLLDKSAYLNILKNIRYAQLTNDGTFFKKIIPLTDTEKGSKTNLYQFTSRYQNKEFKLLSFFNKNKDKVVNCRIVFLDINQKISDSVIKQVNDVREKYLHENKQGLKR